MMDTTISTEATAPAQKAPANGTKSHKARNVRYPIQLRINITPEMNASLGRVARHYDAPEGMVGRMALKQFLMSQDAIFRQQMHAIDMNDRNQP